MGRTRKGHNKGNLISGAPGADNQEEATLLEAGLAGPQASISIFQRLHSENPNDREWACSSLAHIFLEEPLAAIQPLKESNSLQRLVQLTGDAEVSVVTAAAGALRNLTLAAPDELAQQIVDAILGFNGIAPLIHHLEHTTFSLDDEKAEIKARDAMLCQIVGLLSNLIQASSAANAAVTQHNILPLMTKYLQPHLFTQDLMIGCCDFLLGISENNPELQQKMTIDFINLLKLTMANNNNCLLVRVLAIATLCNILPQQDLVGLLKLGLPIMANCLAQFDAGVAWAQIHDAKVKHLQASAATKALSPEDAESAAPKIRSMYSEVSKLVEQWKQQIEAQTVVLEAVANLLVGSDGDADSDEFMELDEEDASLESRLSAHGPGSHHVQINGELLNLLSASGIFAAVVPKTQFHNAPNGNNEVENIDDDPADTTQFGSILFELQLTSLGCLQNIIMSLASSNIPPSHAAETWKAMCDLCGHALSRSDVLPQQILTPVLISTTAIMTDLLRQNQTHGYSLFEPSAPVLEGISQLAKNPLSDHIRSNAVTMLGISALHPAAKQHMEAFGRQLSEALSDVSPWVYAEALNAIFDVFPETDYNDVVRSLGLVAKLEAFVPYLRQQIQEGKKARMDKILLDRLDEARINLTRFIKYKKQQRI